MNHSHSFTAHFPPTTGHTMSSTLQVILLACVFSALPCAAEDEEPIIGESEQVFVLAPQNGEVRGIAWDESDADSPRLLALDRCGEVFAYHVGEDGQLELLQRLDLDDAVKPARLVNPRGLALLIEDRRPVLYFMDWNGRETHLWQWPIDGGAAVSVDLSLSMFRIGDREGLDLAGDGDGLLISYDASGHTDVNRRVQRGILRVAWEGILSENPLAVRHLPDAGTAPARGLATMQLEGVGYLWGTVGNDNVYCADLAAGRGLFFFDRPRSMAGSLSISGMCFGQGALWATENVAGPDRIHRVNVTQNLDAPFVGPRVPRHLVMSISTEPEGMHDEPGAVYHYYSRPFGNDVMPNQGTWSGTERITNLSGSGDAIVSQVSQDPGGDTSSRQILRCIEFDSTTTATYASRYEVDLWTNPYKKFVYPHRVDGDKRALQGAGYLADDLTLYNLGDAATYDAFLQRVRKHIQGKYGVPADMENPYWAARNIVEYIQDNYYYPNPAKRKPATVDYDRGHYDANPANLKIELSDRPYDKTQIIACSGTSVMLTAAMRRLGIPARWLGTGTEMAASRWDANGNGLLDADETATCSNGHRYTQAWLGSRYGWICFDATPSKPAYNDYDVPPPLQSQWRYMTRCASGHREPKRIVFNVGSELIEPLYREFEYDERLAIDNNCGGDQRYNLQGRFEKCELWKSPRHSIQVTNICFLTNIKVDVTDHRAHVTWRQEGAWQRIPEATVSLFLQQRKDGGRWQDAGQAASILPAAAGEADVDLSSRGGGTYRFIIRRDGDPETGGMSEEFDLD